MAERPYTPLSCGMSIDGYLDSAGQERLILSNEADFDRADEVAGGSTCDPRRRLHGPQRRPAAPRPLPGPPARARRAALEPKPVKVTVTCGARLDLHSRFFTTGTARAGLLPGVRRRAARPVWHGRDRGRRRCHVSMSDLSRTSPPAGAAAHGRGAAAPSTLSSSPRTSPTSCSWSWRRSSSATRARRFVDDGPFPSAPTGPHGSRDAADRRGGPPATPLRPLFEESA